MRRALAFAALLTLAACETMGMGGGSVGAGIVWKCDGNRAFRVHFTSNSAQVSAGGRSYSLSHARSGSGARYANGGVEYWEHAGTATLAGARGGPYANCRH